jgi:DNA-binding XRE family transcriptional regulator
VNLRELREQEMMTQAEMAKVLGLSLRTYSRWENAKDPKIPWSRYAILKARFGL